jgi:ketosteroid isomerase-like protein
MKAMRSSFLYVFAYLVILAKGFDVVAQTVQTASSHPSALVETERAFSRTSETQGMRDAFLAFLADDAIIFRPGPVNGKKVWRERPAPTGILSWRPVYADVSAAGDLGYTTGPYEFREQGAQDIPSGYGNFVTIWRRQPDGKWKAILDIGTPNPPPTTLPTLEVAGPRSFTKTKLKISQLTRELEADDLKFSDLAARQGTAPAYLSYLNERARVYRPQQFPLTTRQSIQTFFSNQQTLRATWKPLKAEVAQSGDLGFTYGDYETHGVNGSLIEQGSYMRLWRRQSQHVWKVVLDIFNPHPPRVKH